MVPYSDHERFDGHMLSKEHISNTLGAWVSSRGKHSFGWLKPRNTRMLRFS